MAPFTFKPYNADTDLQTIIDLVSQRPPARVTDYPSITDMRRLIFEEKLYDRDKLNLSPIQTKG